MPLKTFVAGVLTSSDVNTYLMTQCIIRCTSATRPASPSEGWHIYETDTKRRYLYRSGIWVQEGLFQQYAVKDKNEDRDPGPLVLDDDLHLPLEANAVYWFEGMLIATSPTTQWGFISSWGAPLGSSMIINRNAFMGVTGFTDGPIDLRYEEASDVREGMIWTPDKGAAAGTVAYHHLPEGVIKTGSKPGNLQFRWGSDSASTASVTLSSESMITVKRLA